jgi:hypothetical protein
MKNNQKKILRFIGLLFVFITMTLPTISALAQSGLQLSAKRMFGLGIGSMVYTRMVLNVSGPTDLKSVTFLMDGQVMAEVQTPPFKHSFHTKDFPGGWHELSAQGLTESGAPVRSNVLRFRFLSQTEAYRDLAYILIPLSLVALASVLIRLGFFQGTKNTC